MSANHDLSVSRRPLLLSRKRITRGVAAVLLLGAAAFPLYGVGPHNATAAPIEAPSIAESLPGSFADLVDRVSPAVVTITATMTAEPRPALAVPAAAGTRPLGPPVRFSPRPGSWAMPASRTCPAPAAVRRSAP